MNEAEFKARLLLLGAKTHIVPLGGTHVSVQVYNSDGSICWVTVGHFGGGATDFAGAYDYVAPTVISWLEAVS